MARLDLTITATDKASGPLRKIRGEASGLGGTLAKLGKVATLGAAAGLGVLTLGVLSCVKAAMEQQKVDKQLATVLKSTGGVAGVTADQVKRLAGELQKTTPYADEVIQSGQNLLLTFTKIGKDIFPEVTETMLNMSTSLKQDLQTSALQLGKALQDPINGMTALKRAGVSFTEAQKEQVKAMVAAGDTMGAQKLILQELQTEFGGSAKAAGETFAGKLAILKNALGEVQETIGVLLLPILTTLATKLSTFLMEHRKDIEETLQKWIAWGKNEAFPAIKKFLEDVKPIAAAWFDVFKTGLEDIKPVFEYIIGHKAALIIALIAIAGAAAVLGIAFGPFTTAAIAIAAIVTALGLLDQQIKKMQTEEYWQQMVDDLKSVGKTLAEIAAGPFSGLLPWKGHQAGGIVHTPFQIIGERGPELAALPMGTRVYSAPETRQMLGSSGGGGGIDYDRLANTLANTLAPVLVAALAGLRVEMDGREIGRLQGNRAWTLGRAG